MAMFHEKPIVDGPRPEFVVPINLILGTYHVVQNYDKKMTKTNEMG